jgi:hypothetical protein
VLFDTVRLITPETPWGQLWLLNLSIDVLECIDVLTEKGSQQISENDKFALDVQRGSANYLMTVIARRLESDPDIWVDYLRRVVCKR